MGLGLLGGGVGAARYFAERGARVTVTDLRGKDVLASSLQSLRDLPITFVLGRHEEDDFRNADLIVRNPGVPESSPFLSIAQSARIPIETDASLFAREVFRPQGKYFVIGVTGTKGKTTTAMLIGEGFRAAGLPVAIVGIPQTSFLQTLSSLEKNHHPSIIVAELSSWQLESLAHHAVSPPIAVFTSFFPDHLNRHRTMASYLEAKTTIFRFQKGSDVLVIPEGISDLEEILRPRPPRSIIRVENEAINALPPLVIIGAHQRKNAALALAAINAAASHRSFLWQWDPQKTAEALRAIASFRGAPGRLELIATINGRLFVNDTTATNPEATAAALSSFEGPIILIAGGEEKGLPVEGLARAIEHRVKELVLLPGSASEKIRSALNPVYTARAVSSVDTMAEAVEIAWEKSSIGDTILLSPAAASFNLYENEFDRGSAFTSAVALLRSKRA
jgi:UDP-N-acetylmuramoylalanine--D-glutamate ligase